MSLNDTLSRAAIWELSKKADRILHDRTGDLEEAKRIIKKIIEILKREEQT